MKRLLPLLLAVVMTLGLVACGGGNSGGNSGNSGNAGGNATTPPANTGTDAGGAASTSGGKSPDNDFVIAMPNDATHLDPHVSSNGYSNQITNAMYEGLLAFNEQTEIVNVLATDWSVSDDALVYTFKLREGVTFHDGEPFNAEAVKAVWERGKDTSLALNRSTKTWTDVEVLGEYEVAIHIESPNNTFINKLTQVRMISPKAMAMDNASDYLAKNSAGTGAFKLSERVDGGYTKMVPYENYWGEGPSVDSLTFEVVPEDASRLAKLQTGEADLIYPVPVTDIDRLKSESPDIIVDVRDTTIFRYVTLNTEWALPDGRKPFSDKRVRQALNYAFDSEAYAKVVFNGYAKAPTSCFADTIMYHSDNTPYTADLEKAKSLMKEAGYEDGFDVEIIVDNTTIEQKGATFVMQQLSQIGVNVKLLPNESTVNAEATSAPLETTTVQMWYVNWSSGSFEADGSMRSILHSEKFPPSGYNTAFWKNEEFDKPLDDALLMNDTAEIAETYAKAQAIAWEECPWIFLGNDNAIVAYKNYCTGLQFKPGDEVVVTTIGLDR